MPKKVIVVGAGPGGASAAFFLKLFGERRFDVILLEGLSTEKFRKYHRMCGEAVSKRAFRRLEPIKPGKVLNEINRIEIVWPGGARSGWNDHGYVLDRPTMLQKILTEFLNLGGELIGVPAISARGSGDGVKIKLSTHEFLDGDYLVGADGALSIIRKSIFQEEPAAKEVLQQFIVDRKMKTDVLRFIVDPAYRGNYRWEFPYGNKAKIGFPRGTDHVEEYLEKHARPVCFGGLSRIVSGNVCLVGDAAAQANPLTLGGIRTAMEAGKMAALAITTGRLMSYQQWWDGSSFNSSSYLKAHLIARELTREQMEEITGPFMKRLGVLHHLLLYLKEPLYRPLYRSYIGLYRWGW